MTLDLGNSSVHFTEKNSGAPATFGALYGGPNTQLASAANYSIGGLNLNTTFAGAILSSSSLTKNGTGTFTMTGTNTYTGTTTVNSGVLQVGDGVTTSAGSLGTGAISLAGGALVYSKPDDFAVTNRISGSGGSLVKTNSNIMTYSNNTDIASSATVISQGTLALGVAGFMSSPVSVASGATFDVSQNPAFTLNQTLSGFGAVNGLLTAVGGPINPGGAGVAGTLTFNAGLTESGGVNNQLVLSTPGGTNDLINVIGPLTLTGLNNFTLSCFGGGTIPNGTYPLIAYSGALSGDVTNFTVTAVGVTGTLTNITTTTPPEIAVIISPAARGATNLTWVGDGGANNWDTSSSNWVNGATSFAFRTGDSVLFNDSAFPNTNVDVALTVLPASVTVSNTQQYFLTGVGSINGATGLTKTNSGTLSISATNGYTGSTVVEGGTLEVFNIANSGSGSAIGAAASDPSNLVFYGSTFKYSGSSAATDRGATLNGAGVLVDVASGVNLTVNGTLTGPGALTLVDSGTLTLGAANSYTGGTVISNGILATANQTANASGFGTNAITFHGGTLKLYNSTGDDGSTAFTFSNPLIVPAGQTGNLVVFERGVLGSTLTGGGTINVTANGQRGGFGGNWSAFTGIINITSNNIVTTNGIGTNFFRIDNALGYSNAVFNLNDNADLDGGGSGGAYSSAVTFDIGELDGTSLATLSSPAMTKPTPFPTWRVGWKNTTSTFAGTIGDAAGGRDSITKVGTGTWFLSGQNTFSGSTTISNGVLALTNGVNGDGSIGGSTNIFINSGAFLNVLGRSDGKMPLNSGQVISGNGTIRGILDTGAGGTVSPGGGISGDTGTLTVTNTIYLGGTAWMKLNRANSPNSDRLVSSTASTIYYGGTLVVTNIGAPLEVSNTFTLFSATGLYGSFTLVLPYYYTWDTSQLTVNGTITVTGVLPLPKVTKADFSGLAGGSITLNATNGIPYSTVNVISSTNLALPLSSWTVVTNTYFDANGNLMDPNTSNPGLTIHVDPAQTPSFYLLQTLGY
jgi:autotransporter-associated beta strand protein